MLPRLLLALWLLPGVLFALWWTLSANDISFGSIYLSRAMHDAVLDVYATAFGLQPEDITNLLLKGLVVDACLLSAYFGWRYRRAIWESRSMAACRMMAAATWSTLRARFARLRSASSMERSADTVVSRSSQ